MKRTWKLSFEKDIYLPKSRRTRKHRLILWAPFSKCLRVTRRENEQNI